MLERAFTVLARLPASRRARSNEMAFGRERSDGMRLAHVGAASDRSAFDGSNASLGCANSADSVSAVAVNAHPGLLLPILVPG